MTEQDRAPGVVRAAWQGSGQPRVADAGLPRDPGGCACCGELADLVVPVRAVISKMFTAFDQWRRPSGSELCVACSWAFSTPALRSAPHLITRRPATCQLVSRETAAAALLQGPLSPAAALVVPLRPGRKHLLPAAVWGRVTVEDAALPWTAREAGLLQLVLQLRKDGFGSRMLRAPAPPYQVLARLEAGRRDAVLTVWRSLAVWREPDNPWLPLALHLTTPTNRDPGRDSIR